SGSRLINDGNVVWYQGTIHANSETEGAPIVNNGDFEIRDDLSLIMTGTGPFIFECNGRLHKILGNGIASFADVIIWGTGTVEVASGSIVCWERTFGVGVTDLVE
ncbi:MAG: hypothetical protein L0241_11780, partial [Planctomycetia bacterium]|nr:hypothetical protein [Planctomycetia bacterium]